MAKPRASIRAAGGGDAYRAEAVELSEILRDIKAFDKELNKSIRKQMRVAAKPAVEAVREQVRTTPTKGGRTYGVRKAIAQGVGLRISAAKSGGAVTITASPRRLPANRKAMAKLLNQESWRHPVFGDRNTWTTQQGRPYFGSVIWRYRDELRAAVEKALNEASEAIGPR